MRYLVIALLLVLPTFSYSQIGKFSSYDKPIQLGKVERYLGNTYALYTLSYIELDSITRAYVITFTDENTLYNNDKAADIRTLSFKATEEELNYFYSFLQKGFTQTQIRSLEVGQDLVKTVITGSKFLHIVIKFHNGDSASFRVSKKQLPKLFGRK